ncbi:PqiC family protein [Kushneria phosphatilytica]|uniref:Uncharacterized protein n=1 Tax=Kushneria phosphatilytica TaxID=657387 RepID=A0A1S1NNQ3_9GAMM|nr:ABC-type transport auxiliary lipoprotein family protein [Kushneria phosphatilytica]OHV08902.1 hypothetical protein BH688_12930 [Kushneria phosphatilytica]QEL12622.1 hypothetical protein FY550_16725 [Kushneria phosphatilytica]
MMRRLVTLSVLLLALGGCAGQSTSFHRYTLPAPGDSGSIEASSERVVALAPVSLAAYLDGPGVVYQTTDIEVHQAQAHLWAEDLGTQLTRTLRDALARELPQTRVRIGDDHSPEQARVQVSLSQFQGRYDGMAVLSGRYTLQNGQGQLIEQQPFRIERPLPSDGYPALVRTLGAGWQTVAERIAQQLRQHSLTRGQATDAASS